jgi:hypothetical protein
MDTVSHIARRFKRGSDMNKLFALAFVLVSVVSAGAQEAAKPTYLDVIRTCGAEWKESDTRKNTAKGEGMAAWNTFRVECVARKGYVTKSAAKKDFTRVPDKAN